MPQCGAGLARLWNLDRQRSRGKFAACGASLDGPGAPAPVWPRPASRPGRPPSEASSPPVLRPCSSTALSDRLDPEDMREVLEAYRTAAPPPSPVTAAPSPTTWATDPRLFRLPGRARGRRARAVRAALEIVPAVASLGAAGRGRCPCPCRSASASIRASSSPARSASTAAATSCGRWAAHPTSRPGCRAWPRRTRSWSARPRIACCTACSSTSSLGRHQLPGIGETIEVLRIESEQPVGAAVTLDVGAHAVRPGQPGVGARDPRRVLGGGTARRRAGGAPLRRTRHRQVAAGRARSSPAYRRAPIRYCCSSARPTSSTARCIR